MCVVKDCRVEVENVYIYLLNNSEYNKQAYKKASRRSTVL